MTTKLVTGAVGTFAALSLTLSGCNSGKAPSKASLEGQLKKDIPIAQVQAGATEAQYSKFIGCIADYLLKKGKKKDLSDYVSGKKSLNDVQGFDSEENAEKEGKKCADGAFGAG